MKLFWKRPHVLPISMDNAKNSSLARTPFDSITIVQMRFNSGWLGNNRVGTRVSSNTAQHRVVGDEDYDNELRWVPGNQIVRLTSAWLQFNVNFKNTHIVRTYVPCLLLYLAQGKAKFFVLLDLRRTHEAKAMLLSCWVWRSLTRCLVTDFQSEAGNIW